MRAVVSRAAQQDVSAMKLLSVGMTVMYLCLAFSNRGTGGCRLLLSQGRGYGGERQNSSTDSVEKYKNTQQKCIHVRHDPSPNKHRYRETEKKANCGRWLPLSSVRRISSLSLLATLHSCYIHIEYITSDRSFM